MRGVLSKAPSTLMRFRLKTHAFRCVLIGLPSTIIRSAFSKNTHRCENALEGGSNRKRIHIVLLCVRSKTLQARVFIACARSSTYVATCNSIVWNVVMWTVENAWKRKCVRESIDAFSMITKTRTFENALVWTGPKTRALASQGGGREGGGRYSGFQVTWMIAWGRKWKPKKIPTKPPSKNPMPTFRVIKISRKH